MLVNRIAVMLLAGLITAGCSYQVKDSAVLCQEDASVAVVQLPATAATPAHQQRLVMSVEISQFGSNEPFRTEAFWVNLKAYNIGRRIFKSEDRRWPRLGEWDDGEPALPLWYSSEGAYVEREDGSRVAADVVLYMDAYPRAYARRGSAPPRFEHPRIDLNGDETQFVSRPQAWGYGGVYLRFAMRPPAATDRWVLHAGAVEVDDSGQRVAFSPRALCLRKGFRYKGGWSMRP